MVLRAPPLRTRFPSPDSDWIARFMANKKPQKLPRRDTPFVAPAEETSSATASPSSFVIFRETVESIVVAFVLAFLFRTFEAEAFVIPTGSMSPSLQGRHKDVHCAECGFRFRTSASSEDPEEIGHGPGQHISLRAAEVVGGVCQMCGYPMPYTSDLPTHAAKEVSQFTDIEEIGSFRTYPGDRILVNKYGFDFGDPQRWDVIVFKFPGDGNMNYIKRLVGMPGETLRIFHGDVFTRPLGEEGEFQLERKPADKVAAMLQYVHDTDYEPAKLVNAGWPLRWAATTPDGWQVTAEPGDKTVAQRFTVDLPADAPEAQLRYRHIISESVDNWEAAELARRDPAVKAQAAEALEASAIPQLISDFNSYNATLTRSVLDGGQSWSSLYSESFLGMNWVGDLAVEADVEVLEARGELSLDVVEAGRHYRATVDLKSGEVAVTIVDGRNGEPLADFKATGRTTLKAAGNYTVRFANVDDELRLWVDDELVPLEGAKYDPEKLFTDGRQGMIPWADEAGGDQGDLAPAGVAARGAKLEISRLAVLRDVYYIATTERLLRTTTDAMHSDYPNWRRGDLANPQAWNRFLTRRAVEFPIENEQLFAMGDNSPFSQDARVWTISPTYKGQPGGAYLDRRLLIGKAICVFWPHSWGAVPGLPVLPGFPNLGDVRLVR
jgi:signal peptidase I